MCVSFSLLHVQHTLPLTFIHATSSPLPNYPQGWLLSYEGLAGSLGGDVASTHGTRIPLLARTHETRCFEEARGACFFGLVGVCLPHQA